MAYANLTDVLDAAPKLVIGPTTKPSVEDAQKIIEAVENQVNSIVAGLGYLTVTKADSPQSFSILRDIVVQGALARILKAMYYGIRDPEEVGANDAFREFSSKLKALANPDDPLTLSDAPVNQQELKIAANFESNVLDPALMDTDWEPRMTRLQVF